MALKLRRGGRSGEASCARGYPTLDELQACGRDVCGVYLLPPCGGSCAGRHAPGLGAG